MEYGIPGFSPPQVEDTQKPAPSKSRAGSVPYFGTFPAAEGCNDGPSPASTPAGPEPRSSLAAAETHNLLRAILHKLDEIVTLLDNKSETVDEYSPPTFAGSSGTVMPPTASDDVDRMWKDAMSVKR